MTEVEGSLAALISEAHRTLSPPSGTKESRKVEKQEAGPVSSEGNPDKGGPGPRTGKVEKKEKGGGDEPNPPLLDTTRSTRLTVLNGSFRSVSEDDHHHDEDNDELDKGQGKGRGPQTVIVLPDFTFVNGVSEIKEDVERLWRTRLDSNVGRAGKRDSVTSNDEEGVKKSGKNGRFETRPLPYDSVILLCEYDAEIAHKFT